jgi:hypothetical protein
LRWPTRWRALLGRCWSGVAVIECRSLRQRKKGAIRWGNERLRPCVS